MLHTREAEERAAANGYTLKLSPARERGVCSIACVPMWPAEAALADASGAADEGEQNGTSEVALSKSASGAALSRSASGAAGASARGTPRGRGALSRSGSAAPTREQKRPLAVLQVSS
jgi:hypothetical protein